MERARALLLDLVRSHRLPLPVVNGTVAGHVVDFHWPAHRLVVETDGRATHGTARVVAAVRAAIRR